MSSKRYWIRYTSMWTKTEKIASFDSDKEALSFKAQVNGEILPWGGGAELISRCMSQTGSNT